MTRKRENMRIPRYRTSMTSARAGRLALAGLLVGAILTGCAAPLTAQVRPGGALAESYSLEAARNFAGAARSMRTVADAAPKAYFPRVRLAYLQLLAADYAGAADNYSRAAMLAPHAIEPLLGRQQALIAMERWDQAEKVGREILTRDPRSYLGSSRLAWTLYKRGDFAGAGEMYSRVLELYPADVEMRSGLGYALLGAGKKGAAAAAFREVLEMVPDHAGASAGLAAAR